jgi:FKBP12-rapamycin complex-associated protein
MRKNKDSLLAVLEAFVHDPLLNWSDRFGEKGGSSDEATVPEKPRFAGGMSLAMHPVRDGMTLEAETARNSKARQVIDRVQEKLNGRDFEVSL